MRILGVDPGSRLTGYGCIDQLSGQFGHQLHHVAHGTLRLARAHRKEVLPLEDRLFLIYEGLSELIRQFKPQIMVVEKVFFAKNVLSALSLGQARGAVVLTGKIHAMEIAEYNPTEVKLAVVGHGHAAKEEVARMVQLILGSQEFPTLDASDALALAICHAQVTRSIQATRSADELPSEVRLQAIPKRRTKKRFSLAESVGVLLPKKV